MIDGREAFMEGARWWAEREGQELVTADLDAQLSRFLYLTVQADPPEPEEAWGLWPARYIGRAFVWGAKNQEYAFTGATMWQSDQREAEIEALRRYPLAPEDCKPIHMVAKFLGNGNASPLCAARTRRLNLKRELWAIDREAVTCERCLAKLAERVGSPAP